MTTDWQVRLLMSLLKEGTPLVTAAAKAGMSEPTARKYRRVKKLPSELRPVRTWRTREDSLGEVWPDVERMLELDGGLEAKTVFEELQRRHPGRFTAGQLRTLQRRFRQWRALHGPSKEVFFPQVREPGVQCQSDFTDMRQLSVTIGGEPLAHLCFHGGRVFNERYLEVLLQHYGIEASKNTPGNTISCKRGVCYERKGASNHHHWRSNFRANVRTCFGKKRLYSQYP